MRLNNYSRHLLKPALRCATLLGATLLAGQTSHELAVTPPGPVIVKRGATVTATVVATLPEGLHLNSHTPNEDYLIPLNLRWTAGAVEVAGVNYPKPQSIKLPFSVKPLSVLTGKFEITTQLKAAAGAAVGPSTMTGSLRYQACNDQACFPPKTVAVKLPVEVQ